MILKTKNSRIQTISSMGRVERGCSLEGFLNVQLYLQQFGYLREGTFQVDVLDEETGRALKLYQERNGQQPTGSFSEDTRDLMVVPRCGMSDMDNGIAFSANCPWSKNKILYSFDTGTTDMPDNEAFEAVRRAFYSWERATPLRFVEVSSEQRSDVAVGWRPADDTDYSMVASTIAHADYPPGCSRLTENTELPKPLHFDDSEHSWCDGLKTDAFDVESVALHEIGHSLGLRHSGVREAVMYPSFSTNSIKRVLSQDDIAGIRDLYPILS